MPTVVSECLLSILNFLSAMFQPTVISERLFAKATKFLVGNVAMLFESKEPSIIHIK